jgi:hypothetical protein
LTTVRFEPEERAKASKLLALELCELLTFGEALWHGLTMHFSEFRFVVEEFQVGWAAGHGEPNDSLGALRKR